MTTTPAKKPSPYHRLALLAFALAIVAAGFALYGSFLSELHLAESPLNRLRSGDRPSIGLSGPARFYVPFAAFAVPLALGLASAFLGAAAMRAIERGRGATSGSGAAVFAIMIGGLSAVIAGNMIFAVYGWRYIPTVYTY